MGFYLDEPTRATDTFAFDAARGELERVSIVHKFGGNPAVGTSFVPVAVGGVYQTPQVGSQTQLRVKAGGNAADDAAGNGAREVTLYGIDETGAEISEAVATAGESASSATTDSFLRLFRVIVTASGTYATQSAGSHTAAITIENAAGGTDWATISATDFPRGQSEIGAYTVPLGYTAYVPTLIVTSDSSKSTDFLFFQRQNILETSAPYTAMRQVVEAAGLAGEEIIQPRTPFGPFPALTDIGFLAKVSTGTGAVEVDFEIILVADDS